LDQVDFPWVVIPAFDAEDEKIHRLPQPRHLRLGTMLRLSFGLLYVSAEEFAALFHSLWLFQSPAYAGGKGTGCFF
jgi:hypothetical protein